MEHEETEVYWPIGRIICWGYYYLDGREPPMDEIKEPFCLYADIEPDDYDTESGFADDEFDRIIQEKIGAQLPKNHFDLNITDTQEE